MYILKVYSIHYTYSDKTQMLKKFPSDKLNGRKNALFFLSRAPANDSFSFQFAIPILS